VKSKHIVEQLVSYFGLDALVIPEIIILNHNFEDTALDKEL